MEKLNVTTFRRHGKHEYKLDGSTINVILCCNQISPWKLFFRCSRVQSEGKVTMRIKLWQYSPIRMKYFMFQHTVSTSAKRTIERGYTYH